MSYPTATDIGQEGEAAVVRSLGAGGWTISNWDTQGAGATDIVAHKNGSGILVQVKTALSPNLPASPGPLESALIRARAARNGYTPWLAQVVLSPLGLAAPRIQYNRI